MVKIKQGLRNEGREGEIVQVFKKGTIIDEDIYKIKFSDVYFGLYKLSEFEFIKED